MTKGSWVKTILKEILVLCSVYCVLSVCTFLRKANDKLVLFNHCGSAKAIKLTVSLTKTLYSNRCL